MSAPGLCWGHPRQIGVDENQDTAQDGQHADIEQRIAKNKEDIGEQRVKARPFREVVVSSGGSIAETRCKLQ